MFIRQSGFRPNLVRAAVAAALGSVLVTGVSFAAEGDSELAEVQVTGTRIQQRGDYVSPTPMATFGAEDLEKLGIVNVSDAMTQIPQNVSQFTPANTGGSAFFVGSTLANLRGLNPFFGTRTLTLVDSRRFIPTTQGDSVDLNFIPSNMISRMEVVTGGASAAYGSGAISGVVNVILDKNLTGIKVDMDYGVTGQGDGDNYHIGLAGGMDFAGDRGHVIAGGEYQKSDVIQSCSDARDWCGDSRGFFNNNTGFAFAAGLPYTPKIAGQPNFVVTPGLTNNQTSSTGVIFQSNVGGAFGQGGFFGPPGAPIAPATNQTAQFNAAGTDIVPYTVGQEGWRSIGGLVVGGSGDSAYKNLTLYPEVERKTFFSHADFEITDTLGTYLEVSYGQVEASNNQWETGQNSTGNCIKSDNAFLGTLSTNARNALAAASGNSVFGASNEFCAAFAPGTWATVVQKNWNPQNLQTVFTDTKVTRVVAGLDGKFGDTWSWDAYYQYGKTTRDQIGDQYRTNWRYTMAVDAVLDTRVGSATLGQPVCRVTNTGVMPSPTLDPILAQGCQPLNVFGNKASPAALAYAFGDLTEHDDIRQDVLAASATGELWEGWGAGALAAAVGVEYRKDSLDNNAGDLPFAIRTDFPLQYGDSFAGETEVAETFLELEMPILKDMAFADVLTLNGAVRYAHYKTTGGAGTIGGTNSQDITTWKIAGVWDPINWLRVRGSHSKDLRAAGFRELFYSQSIPEGGFFGVVNNPWQNPAVNNGTDNSVLILSGNVDIKPETGTTTTAGFVLSPSGWAEGMHFSFDYYDIKLEDGMALGGAQNNINQCYAGDTYYCQFVTFGTPLPGNTPNSNITSTRAIYINQQTYKTKGFDVAWDYSIPVSDVMGDVPGNVSFRLTASHALETIVPSGADVAGQNGVDQGFLSDFAASPDWSGNLTISYANGGFVGTLQTRYVSAGNLDQQNPKTGPDSSSYNPNLTYSVNDNTIPSYFNFNGTVSYDFKLWGAERTEAFLTVNNIFDKEPPFAGTGFQGTGGTNVVFYDALGRTFRVGVRAKF
jgi:iron complex outermembrane recepter protein